MKLNIEAVRKKETANIINFNTEIKYDNEESEYRNLLDAEKIDYIKISGDVLQENGLAVIKYEICTDFTAECARCNKISQQSITVSGKKYLADKSDEKEDNEDYYTLENPSIIDLNDFITEFLGLQVPSRYLCDEDCKGLCQKCGKDLNTGECNCPKKEKNPAFNILDNLKF